MSIYPVRLSEWFPPGNERHTTAFSLVSHMRCFACGGNVRWKGAWAHHSLPWGNGDLWCRLSCLKSGRRHRVDKRQNRKFKRLLKSFGRCNGASDDSGAGGIHD